MRRETRELALTSMLSALAVAVFLVYDLALGRLQNIYKIKKDASLTRPSSFQPIYARNSSS